MRRNWQWNTRTKIFVETCHRANLFESTYGTATHESYESTVEEILNVDKKGDSIQSNALFNLTVQQFYRV